MFVLSRSGVSGRKISNWASSSTMSGGTANLISALSLIYSSKPSYQLGPAEAMVVPRTQRTMVGKLEDRNSSM